MFVILLSALLSSTFSWADESVLYSSSYKEKIFPKQSKCHIKKFGHYVYDKGFINFLGQSNLSRFSMMAALWEVSAPECATDYSVVQFIKGCSFRTLLDKSTGKVESFYGLSRENRGKTTPFKHDNWEVDSVDVDPMFNSSDDPAKRFELIRIAKKNLQLNNTALGLSQDEDVLFDSRNYGYLGEDKAPPQLFVTDIPEGSSLNPDFQENIDFITTSSLLFKTCLYKTAHVPLTGDPLWFNHSGPRGPLHCFSWSDNSRFDLVTRSFVRSDVIDPFCSTEVTSH